MWTTVNQYLRIPNCVLADTLWASCGRSLGIASLGNSTRFPVFNYALNIPMCIAVSMCQSVYVTEDIYA